MEGFLVVWISVPDTVQYGIRRCNMDCCVDTVRKAAYKFGFLAQTLSTMDVCIVIWIPGTVVVACKT
jgi:hypothetical protein